MNPDKENNLDDYTVESEDTNHTTDDADLTVREDAAGKKNDSRNKIIMGAIALVGTLAAGQVGYSMFFGNSNNPPTQMQTVQPIKATAPTDMSVSAPQTNQMGNTIGGDTLPQSGQSLNIQAGSVAITASAPTDSLMNGLSPTVPDSAASSMTVTPMVVASAPTIPASTPASAPTVASAGSLASAINNMPTEPTPEPVKAEKNDKKNKKIASTEKAEECTPPAPKKATVVHKLVRPNHKGNSPAKEEPSKSDGSFFNKTSSVEGHKNASVTAVLEGRAWISLNGKNNSVKNGDRLSDGAIVKKVDPKNYTVLTSLGTIQ